MSVIKTAGASVLKWTSKAEEVWRGLNGLVTLYKASDNSIKHSREILTFNLCKDLNEMETRPWESYVSIEGETDKRMRVALRPSYADHELVVGPRYQQSDFKFVSSNILSNNMSGILLIGINRGTRMAHKIKETNPMKFYKVKGILGQATDNSFINGKIVEKSTYKFIKRHHIDMICASIQSSHQKKMFESCGVDIQSQAAYDLAIQGPIRPVEHRIPMMYSLKCIDFNSPEFTLEIACLNEDEAFFTSLVNGLGLQLKSTATCTQIQCCQYGIFNLDTALLKRDWDLKTIVQNMHKIRRICGKNKFLFQQDDPILREYLYDTTD